VKEKRELLEPRRAIEKGVREKLRKEEVTAIQGLVNWEMSWQKRTPIETLRR